MGVDLRWRERRGLRRRSRGADGAQAGGVRRDGAGRLALPARPRPDRLHRRHREPVPALEAYDVAVVPDGPGQGSSVVLVQQWKHHSEAFMQLPGRGAGAGDRPVQGDSVELDESVMPPTSHVSRTVLERDGVELPIFRRNTAYGGVDRARHAVRRVLPRAVPAGRDAAPDGRGRRRRARRVDPVHHPADRGLLRRALRSRTCSEVTSPRSRPPAQCLHGTTESEAPRPPTGAEEGAQALAAHRVHRDGAGHRGRLRRGRLREEVPRRVRPVAVGARPPCRRRCTTTTRNYKAAGTGTLAGTGPGRQDPRRRHHLCHLTTKTPVPVVDLGQNPTTNPGQRVHPRPAARDRPPAGTGSGARRRRPAGPVPLAFPRLPPTWWPTSTATPSAGHWHDRGDAGPVRPGGVGRPADPRLDRRLDGLAAAGGRLARRDGAGGRPPARRWWPTRRR